MKGQFWGVTEKEADIIYFKLNLFLLNEQTFQNIGSFTVKIQSLGYIFNSFLEKLVIYSITNLMHYLLVLHNIMGGGGGVT